MHNKVALPESKDRLNSYNEAMLQHTANLRCTINKPIIRSSRNNLHLTASCRWYSTKTWNLDIFRNYHRHI